MLSGPAGRTTERSLSAHEVFVLSTKPTVCTAARLIATLTGPLPACARPLPEISPEQSNLLYTTATHSRRQLRNTTGKWNRKRKQNGEWEISGLERSILCIISVKIVSENSFERPNAVIFMQNYPINSFITSIQLAENYVSLSFKKQHILFWMIRPFPCNHKDYFKVIHR